MPEKKRNLLRMVAGVYLIYLGASMGKKALAERPENMWVFLIFAVIFIAVGAVLVIREWKYPSICADTEAEKEPGKVLEALPDAESTHSQEDKTSDRSERVEEE